MRRWIPLLVIPLVLMGCSLFGGVSRLRESVEFYATQLPQTLTAQLPTLEAVVTQVGEAVATVAAATPTPQVPTPEATPAQPSGEVPSQGMVSQSEEIRTGRERFVHRMVIGDRTYVFLEWEHRFDRDRQAEEWHIRQGSEPENVYVYVDGTFWHNTGSGWVQVAGSKEDVVPRFLTLVGEPPSDTGYEEVGREEVNGMEAIHYRATISGIPPSIIGAAAPPDMPPFPVPPRVEQVVWDGWITPEGYLVKSQIRFHMTFTLMDGSQTQGYEELVWEAMDLNQPVEIATPQAAEAPEPPVPLPEGAELQVYAEAQRAWLYNVADTDVETVAAWYQEQLPAQGFQVVESYASSAAANFVVQAPDGSRWRIDVAFLGAGVGITVQPQE